ncbi:MAG: hypothetical protein ABL889_19970 [Terricaulis sp.]
MSETSAKPASDAKRAKQGRSPAYPSLALGDALEKAKDQFQAEGKYAIPMPSAFKAWGYSDKSSGGRETRASLRYFGLITVEGEGESAKVKLTDDALRVILDERPDQTEKKAIIKRLALNPTAHKKLWARFADGIKSDATAAHYLMFDEGYNKSAADALVGQFKQTAAYAGLYEPDSIPVIVPQTKTDDELEDEEAASEQETTPKRRRESVKAGMKEDVFTLKEGAVVMQWPERLSPDSFADLETWATLMLRKIKREAVDAPEVKPRRTAAELLGDDPDE